MNSTFLVGVISGAIVSGTSLLYATLGEIISERAGIINLGIEGLMLVGAASSFAITATAGSPVLGILVGSLLAGVLNLGFGYLVIKRKANQLASGLAMMFFGTGLSAMIGKSFVGVRIQGLPRWQIPGLTQLPGVGPSHFNFDALIYLVFPLSVLIWWVLYRTRYGLGLRAAGEDPSIAFAAGWSPSRIQSIAVFLGGLFAGMAGSHLSVAYTLTWSEGMTAGRGFIAIALVIFSRWNPQRAILGALLFGGAVAFQLRMQSRGAQISSFLLDMTPYLLTLLVLAIWGGGRRQAAPAHLGQAFEREGG